MKKATTKFDPKLLYFNKVYDFFAKYMHEQKAASMHTVTAYKEGLKTFGNYVEEIKGIPLGKFRFDDVTYDFFLDFRNYLHETKGCSESTCNNRLSANRTYLEYCAARDISIQPILFGVSRVPFYKVPKVRQPIIEDKNALAALLNAPSNTDKGIRDKTVLCFLYNGGLRVEELVKLRLGDVISGNVTQLLIHGKGAKERTVELDEKTTSWSNMCRSIYHGNKDPMCPFFYTVIGGQKKEMTTRNVRDLVAKYADKVRPNYNLPDRVSPHTLRRTRGTMLYRDGVPLEVIARMFGHANVEVTKEHYAFPSEEQMLDTARKQTDVIPSTEENEVPGKNLEQAWPNDMNELKKILGF